MVLVTTEQFKSQSKTVCVIGAGPSGLVSARELKKEGHKVVVMEQNDDVGGQWLYQPNVEEEDPLGKTETVKVHSSVYSSLRLATPREVMGFSDFPFTTKKGRDARRFPGHEELWLYLKDFSQVFGLREMIRFNVRVDFVGMVNDVDMKRWMVKSVEKKSGEVIEEVYDAVVVASGHYSYPRLPSIKGMDLWKRKQLHSHIYRMPDPFRDEVEVVVGCSTSGQDISIELVEVAKEVHLSAKSLDIPPGLSKVISKYENLHLHPQIESLEEDGRVIFVDGSCIVADTILYCTGEADGIPKRNTHDIADFNYSDKYADYIGFQHLEEWRKMLCKSAILNSLENLETYRDSWDDDDLLLQTLPDPYFTQLSTSP